MKVNYGYKHQPGLFSEINYWFKIAHGVKVKSIQPLVFIWNKVYPEMFYLKLSIPHSYQSFSWDLSKSYVCPKCQDDSLWPEDAHGILS